VTLTGTGQVGTTPPGTYNIDVSGASGTLVKAGSVDVDGAVARETRWMELTRRQTLFGLSALAGHALFPDVPRELRAAPARSQP
jgi:hypothetical protein